MNNNMNKNKQMKPKKTTEPVEQNAISEDIKSKTMAAALKLLNSADKGIPDFREEREKKNQRPGMKKVPLQVCLDRKEEFLWNTYKKHPEVFTKEYRFTPERKEMRKFLSYADKTIEDWERTLDFKPGYVQMLEKKYPSKNSK